MSKDEKKFCFVYSAHIFRFIEHLKQATPGTQLHHQHKPSMWNLNMKPVSSHKHKLNTEF